MVGDGALHREATVGANREGHESLAGEAPSRETNHETASVRRTKYWYFLEPDVVVAPIYLGTWLTEALQSMDVAGNEGFLPETLFRKGVS